MTPPVRLYTTPWCPYCQSAKEFLDNLGVAYEDIDVDRHPDVRARVSAENGGYRTVPMILIGDEFIGGYSDLKALDDRGELRPRLGLA